MAIEVTDASFKQEVLESNILVLVDFWASWCQPCLMVVPILEEIAKAYEGKLKVCKVNVDEAREKAIEYGVMNIPTLAIFKDGQVVDKIIGVVPKETIQSKINPYL